MLARRAAQPRACFAPRRRRARSVTSAAAPRSALAAPARDDVASHPHPRERAGALLGAGAADAEGADEGAADADAEGAALSDGGGAPNAARSSAAAASCFEREHVVVVSTSGDEALAKA